MSDQDKLTEGINRFQAAMEDALDHARGALARKDYQAASDVLTGLTQATAKLSVGLRSYLIKQKLIKEG